MTDLNIYQRLHAVMGEVDYVQKEKKQGMNYTIVSHDAVTAKVRPILHKHGIVYHPHTLDYVQDGNRTQVNLTMRFVNVDKPDDFVDVPCLGFGIDSQDKGPGKAVSYAVKYALLKALGLETGDDPDTEVQTPPHEPAPKSTQPAVNPAYVVKGAKDADDYLKRLIALVAGAPDAATVQAINDANRPALDKLAAVDRPKWDAAMRAMADRTHTVKEAA